MTHLDLAPAPSAAAVGVPAEAWERIAASLTDGRTPSTLLDLIGATQR